MRPNIGLSPKTGNLFQSTHSLRSATIFPSGEVETIKVSIHALLAECDFPANIADSVVQLFQSTHSLRSATSFCPGHFKLTRFQSTHSLRSATDSRMRLMSSLKVSIHALLAECDPRNGNNQGRVCCFNPRTPCGVRQKEIKQ